MMTVPKEWVEQLQLKKGDLVSTEIDEGSLVITPTTPKHAGHSRTIDIDQLKDQRFLDLSITASYIQGNDVTRIFSSSNKMQPHHKQMIRQTLEGIMGVEVSEDYADHVELINLIDPAKFSLLDTIERFSATSAAVLSDAVTALDRGDATPRPGRVLEGLREHQGLQADDAPRLPGGQEQEAQRGDEAIRTSRRSSS